MNVVRMNNPHHESIKDDIVQRVAGLGPLHDRRIHYREKEKVFAVAAKQFNEEHDSELSTEQIKKVVYKKKRISLKNHMWDLPRCPEDDDCEAMYADREEVCAKVLYGCSTSLVIVSIQIALALTDTAGRTISTVRPKEIHHFHAHTQRELK